MRRFLAFLVLVAAGYFIYRSVESGDFAEWRMKLEYERAAVAEASATVLSDVAGADEAVRYYKAVAGKKDARWGAAKRDRDNAGERLGYLVALAIVAFIVWVWPKSVRHPTPAPRAESTTVQDTAATHRTPARDDDDESEPLGPNERIAFVTTPKAESADLSATACQVCGEALESEVVMCERCRTPHHEECWKWNKGCSTFGCGERSFDRIESRAR